MTLQAPLVKGEKKPGTCEEQLRRMVKDIANDITSGEGDAAKWMENTYDIRYLVDQNKMFLGAESLGSGCLKLYEGAVVRELVACGLTLEACASELDACCLKLETLGQ